MVELFVVVRLSRLSVVAADKLRTNNLFCFIRRMTKGGYREVKYIAKTTRLPWRKSSRLLLSRLVCMEYNWSNPIASSEFNDDEDTEYLDRDDESSEKNGKALCVFHQRQTKSSVAKQKCRTYSRLVHLSIFALQHPHRS